MYNMLTAKNNEKLISQSYCDFFPVHKLRMEKYLLADM